MDVALASCKVLPEPDFDAQPLEDALSALGIRSVVLPWDDPQVDWSVAPLAVLRSTWNYPEHPEAFAAWLQSTGRVTSLLNPPGAALRNLHKRYLLDLAEAGVPTTPTVVLERGSERSLRDVMQDEGWSEAVVKPAISAASFKTLRVGPDSLDLGEAHLRELVAGRDVLVQAYLPSVEGYGERALVWIDGELTHAVRKSPRWDGEEESVSEALPIDAAEADLAQQALAVVDAPLLYARIDVAPGPDGSPLLMELELLEPSLFFPQEPRSLTRFAEGIHRRLQALG